MIDANNLMLFDEFEEKVPVHTQLSIEDYLLRGFPPSSFLEAVLTNDLFRATNSSDHVNFKQLGQITKWIVTEAPHGSFGNAENIENWVTDKDNRRTKFTDKISKKRMWEKLND